MDFKFYVESDDDDDEEEYREISENDIERLINEAGDEDDEDEKTKTVYVSSYLHAGEIWN